MSYDSSAEELDLDLDGELLLQATAAEDLDCVVLTHSEQRMLRKFEDLDHDRTGTVSKNALLKWLRQGENLSATGAVKIFARWSTLLDDRVSFEEFCDLYRAVDDAYTYTVCCDVMEEDCHSIAADTCGSVCLALFCSLFTCCLSWLCLCAYTRHHHHRGTFISKGLTGEKRSKKRYKKRTTTGWCEPRPRDEQGCRDCEERCCLGPKCIKCRACCCADCHRRTEAQNDAADAAAERAEAKAAAEAERDAMGNLVLTDAEQRMLRKFDALDHDHVGVVTKTTLLKWLRQGENLSREGAAKIFARWPTSLDDSVSFEEFCELYRAVDGAFTYTVCCDMMDDDCRSMAPDSCASVCLALLCSLVTCCLSWLCLCAYTRLHHHRGEFVAKGLTGEPRSKRVFESGAHSCCARRICRARCDPHGRCERGGKCEQCMCCCRKRHKRCRRLHPEGELSADEEDEEDDRSRAMWFENNTTSVEEKEEEEEEEEDEEEDDAYLDAFGMPV
tara:strand:- start:3 stop:1508 length:1506 start_codon:yes stop_codon:yes gene_type:complete